jgi:hypothetical protein
MDPYLIVVLFLTLMIGLLACVVGCEYLELRRERTFEQDANPS